MAIKITDVGVETFSETQNNSVKIEKLQISTPLPANALHIPSKKEF